LFSSERIQKMNTVTLFNGHKMPLIGLGTWRVDPKDIPFSVKTAIKEGYRHIDCAAVYLNEKQVGISLQEALKENNLKREDVFITSKLWNTYHKKEHVRKACEKTLKDLQLQYLDLYLIHWPIAFEPVSDELNSSSDIMKRDENGKAKLAKVSIQETWRAMEQLVDDGLVKSIGVSNFTIPLLHDLLSYARIKPAVNQVEYHPYYQQTTLLDYCRKEGVVLQGYSILGAGDKAAPLFDETIKSIASKKKKSPAQVILRWAIQKGIVVLPKVSNEWFSPLPST
jgi:diketogulonate reductase-like aldo/keto reductase